MAHGERAAKKSNSQREYWSPRPGNFGTPRGNSGTKKYTHKIERRRRTRECEKHRKGLGEGDE